MNNIEQDTFLMADEWKQKYPGAKAGILVIKNINSVESVKFEEIRANLETSLRTDFKGFSREDLNNLPVIKAYGQYYKNFNKTYHVRSQVESVVNGKSLKSASPVLTAMFMAEVKNMLLTAGHDLDVLKLPVRITLGTSNETFVDIRGVEKRTEKDDMIMMDKEGVISSVVLGPDSRTKITPNTKNILFAVYAPSDIETGTVLSHLKDIENYIKILAPDSQTELIKVFEAK